MTVTATEQLEVFTENDETTGRMKLRSEVHRDGDWHRTAHVYIVNGTGELLVHLRSPFKDSTPNCWDTRFGGHILPGVAPVEAAVSEVFEELGIRLTSDELTPLPKQRYDGVTNREHIYPFVLYRDVDLAACRFSDGEVVEVRWLSPEAIISEMAASPKRWGVMVDSFKNILPRLDLKHGRS